MSDDQSLVRNERPIDTRTDAERAHSIAVMARTYRTYRDTGVKQGPLFLHLLIDPDEWLNTQHRPFEEVETEYKYRLAFHKEIENQDLHPETIPPLPTFRETVAMFAPELLSQPGFDEFIGDGKVHNP